MFDVTLAHGVDEVGQDAWDCLGQVLPFTSSRWYRFGETVLSDELPIYAILSRHGEPVARATFWLRCREVLPLSSPLLRRAISGILQRRPLLVCESPLAGAAGLILPTDLGLRREAMQTLIEIGREQARVHRASFLLFTYLGRDPVAGWPAGVVRSLGAGTSMAIAWPDFEFYLASLSRWARKSVRQNLKRAEEQGIVVRAHPTVTRLDEALHLIRNVEHLHHTGENVRARAILQHAGMVEATWVTAEQGSRLVACGLLLGERDTRSMTLLGLDDGVEYAYFALFYGCIRRAIEEGVRLLRGGATTYGFKERLGFELEDDEYIAFAGRGPFVLAERLAHLFPVD